ncbi:DUF4230 domain-containing protein [Actinoallomurus sp. CA-150999]|uniref:DUF4230 domain-containing protein n=1 Tax=Actinoallomurus sp. CA-150999 TaxID=3239887 RepID=UPI003D91C887
MVRPEAPEDEPSSRPPRRPGIRLIAFLVVLVALAYAALQAVHALPHWLNPFSEQTKDRSGPAVLQSIQNISRYEAATGQFQVVVDLEKDARFLPSQVRGRRTLFVGTGSVDSYVDFSHLGNGAVVTDKNRTSVTIRLPHARLEKTNLDPKHSYVFAQERGLFDRIGDFFSSNPNQQQQLYQLAAQKIQDAAGASGLAARADENTKQMITNLLRALGFKNVTVTYATSP